MSLLKRCLIAASVFAASCVASAAPVLASDSTVEANLNLSRCLVYKEAFGETLVYNICTGENTSIAWAFGDWAGFLALSGLAVLLVGGLTTLVIAIIRS